MEDPKDEGVHGQAGDSSTLDQVAARVKRQLAAAHDLKKYADEARDRAIEARQEARGLRELLARDPLPAFDVRQTAFESLPTPAAIIGRTGRVLGANSHWRDWFGPALCPSNDFFAGWAAAGGDPTVSRGVRAALDGDARTDVEVSILGTRRAMVQVAPTAPRTGWALIVVIDLTDQYERAEQLLFEATHDPLTGLANRAFLTRELGTALTNLRRYGQRFGLLYLDLDRFKPVNDTYGHAVGDRLLRDLAERWSHLVRAPDVLARLGGDEFVVLVSRLEQESQLVQIATRFREALSEPFAVDGGIEINLSVSFGIAEPSADMTAEEALAAADHSMYTDKIRGASSESDRQE